MQNFNSFWVATLPRTGSMWTINILREIFTISKFNVFPKIQLKSDQEFLDLYKNNAINDTNFLNKYVLKIHTRLSTFPPKSKIITNIRNPYDICASFYEFMKSDLDKAIECGFRLSVFINHYRNISKDVFEIRYEEIENEPEKLIKKLVILCDLNLSDNQIKKILKKYSKENISKLIKSNDDQVKLDILDKKNIDNRRVIVDDKNHYRYFDLKTGFQTNHISSRKSGQWRAAFTDNQIKKIIDKLDPIATEFGYNSELLN